MNVARVFALMVSLGLLGLGLRRLGWLDARAAPHLNRVALYVTLPVGVFLALYQYPLHADALAPPAILALLTFVLWGASTVLARALLPSAPERAAFVLAAVFGNTAFLGYPVASAAYGQEGLAVAVLVDQLGCEPLSFTLGAFIAATGASQGKVSWGRELLTLAKMPLLWALVAGVAWQAAGGPALPDSVESAGRVVAGSTVVLVMVSLGLVLRAGSLVRAWRAVMASAALRLVFAPAFALGASAVVGLGALERQVLVTQAGMPTMMFTLVLALRYGLDAELMAAFITGSMLGALVTVPMWMLIAG